jgi:hypothetical protein
MTVHVQGAECNVQCAARAVPVLVQGAVQVQEIES